VKAGERGSALTRQLQAYGRKQVLAPRVLLMSGDADPARVEAGVRVEGTRFLGKPFAAAELTHRVRELLDTP
jgi:DNA-binding response OmpR family regulator